MTTSSDRPLVVPCPGCGAVMWANSSRCPRCRLADEPPAHGARADEPATKDKTRRN